MRTAGRYVALQVPSWLVAAGVCWFLWHREVIGATTAAVLVALWVLKDAALYPLVRRGYEPSRGPAQAMVGREAIVQEALAPEGWVRMGSERWRARLAPGAADASAGAIVVVEAVDGLTLVVRTR